MSLAAAVLVLTGCRPTPSPPSVVALPATSRLDPRLDAIRAAARGWEARLDSGRAVVDQVALVPDVPTFLRAIRAWDRNQFFPILIETDAEATLRFVRAFRPARIVRLPRFEAMPPTPDALWRVAGASVLASWGEAGHDSAVRLDDLAGDPQPSRSPAARAPGVVVSAPTAPMLAGAVALAAGHGQPLLRFDSPQGFSQNLSLDEFRAWDRELTVTIKRSAPHALALGDDCDFLTVAGNYPYRYRDERGEIEAVDDGIGRDPTTAARWAFAGRLLGDAAPSVARAMAALFLQPEAATLFNGYDEGAPPWLLYATQASAQRLAGRLPTRQYAGPSQGTVAAWAEAFDPENRAGLVWINSHGSPRVFHLRDEPASAAEVPRTVPVAVVMVHSFSASDPTDTNTIAGRWLANGAFVYFGALNEPFLQAFRTPDAALDLALEGIPLAASLRLTSLEPYGQPWRLVYLGDPLFRLQKPRLGTLRNFPPVPGGPPPSGRLPGRLTPPPEPTDWSVVAQADQPQSRTLTSKPAADAPTALAAAWDLALAAMIRPGDDPTDPPLLDAIAELAAIDRECLPALERGRLDVIRADLLSQADRIGELRARLQAIPASDRSPAIRRWHEALQASELAWLLSGGDLDRIIPAWDRLIGSDTLAEFQVHATARVGATVRRPDDRRAWAIALRRALERPLGPEVAAALRRELDRVEPSPTPAPGSSPIKGGSGRTD